MHRAPPNRILLLGEICRRIRTQICYRFLFFAFASCKHTRSFWTHCDCDCILDVWACVFVCKFLCVHACFNWEVANEYWLSVMFVKRAFVFEGVSKTTHSVQYSDTTDAIFSLVYYMVCFHIPVFGLCFDLFWNVCACLLERTKRAFASLTHFFFSFSVSFFFGLHGLQWYVLKRRWSEWKSTKWTHGVSIHHFPHEI